MPTTNQRQGRAAPLSPGFVCRKKPQLEGPHPFDYFTLFFTHALLELITQHTNQYTAIQRLEGKEGQREWYNLAVEELYIFLGYIIYIGIYKEPDISIY